MWHGTEQCLDQAGTQPACSRVAPVGVVRLVSKAGAGCISVTCTWHDESCAPGSMLPGTNSSHPLTAQHLGKQDTTVRMEGVCLAKTDMPLIIWLAQAPQVLRTRTHR